MTKEEVVFKHFINDEWIEEFGKFHKWGISYDEFPTGPALKSIAIIEDIYGQIVEVTPRFVKFIKTTEEGQDAFIKTSEYRRKNNPMPIMHPKWKPII